MAILWPVVIVGPNGSGKSIFLSYIVDALNGICYKTAFRDIVPSQMGSGKPYYQSHPLRVRIKERSVP